MPLLQVLEMVDFDWVKHIDKIWSDDPTDVPGIHRAAREDFSRALARLVRSEDSASPLGWVVTGAGGSGKTHLLGSFRRETLEKGGYFIVIDMSGVRDVWETILLHTVHSVRTAGPDGKPQVLRLLERVVATSRTRVDADGIAAMFQDDLAAAIKKTVNGLYRVHPVQMQEHQDVLRAMLLLASDEMDLSDRGRNWLLGLEPDGDAIALFGFKRPVCDPKAAVAGISWLMSLGGGFSVFALDQLDAIVKQHIHPEADAAGDETATARNIIVGLCDGLSALRDLTRRTLAVVSCHSESWRHLQEFGLRTALDRYRKPILLPNLDTVEQVEALVEARMARAFAQEGLTAPYPTWPFPPEVLCEMAASSSPRHVLQRCDQHVHDCLVEGIAREAVANPENEPVPVLVDEVSSLQRRIEAVARRYREELEKPLPADCKDKAQEDDFWHRALMCFARAFRFEHPPMAEADIVLDDDKEADGKFPLLHARIRLETMGGENRDRHLGLRALLQPNARAFQNRLKAAMTQSGIDRNLSFRKLALVHFGPHPTGKVTGELIEQFHNSGGVWIHPSDDAVRCLAALTAVEREFPGDWGEWVAGFRPLRTLGFLHAELGWLLGDAPEAASGQAATVPPPPEQAEGRVAADVPAEAPVRDAADAGGHAPAGKNRAAADRIPLGRTAGPGNIGSIIDLPVEALKQHVAILAGSGSGKTVLIKRLVEEAALCGIPAVVVDVANDLACMGQPWVEEPAAWGPEDRDKAKEYFERVEVKIWTPGRRAGNPLRLRQIPDLAAVAGDEDELAAAVTMSVGAVAGILKIGSDHAKEGIVVEALRWMASHGGGDLRTLAGVLHDLPEDSEARFYDKAEKVAGDMAAQLHGALITNPLLGGRAEVTDIAELLRSGDGRTRVSIVNLAGLGNIQAQQVFVSQLTMSLFGWIKNTPSEGVGGLLVIDEAKEFVPSLKSTPCKDSVVRFAAQARKYGMGLVLATQEPKSVDTKVVGNCNTQFFGRQNSPVAIAAAESLLERSGVSKLDRGHFFVKSVALGAAPIRIATPLCLTRHSASPPNGDEVLAMAQASS